MSTATKPVANDTVLEIATFDLEEATLEECAAEYKRLGPILSPIDKLRKDIYKKILSLTRLPDRPTEKGKENNKKTRKELSNGIFVQRTRYLSDGFDWEKFVEEQPEIYAQYTTEVPKEKVTIGYLRN